MPLLYFVDPDRPAHKMLRAVLSWSECNLVVEGISAVRIADDPQKQPPTEVAFLVGPEEANQKWPSGLYALNIKMSDANESLQALQKIPARQLALKNKKSAAIRSAPVDPASDRHGTTGPRLGSTMAMTSLDVKSSIILRWLIKRYAATLCRISLRARG